MTPRLLIYDRPQTGLEAKFSMPFCAAAAVTFGHPTVEAFDEAHIRDSRVQAVMPRVSLRGNPAFDAAAPLSQSTVTMRLRDGRTLSAHADGARGYPGRLTAEELGTKFLGCARRSLPVAQAEAALAAARALDGAENLRPLMVSCTGQTD